MTLFGYFRRQPGNNDFTHLRTADGLTSQCEDIGIVVLARIPRNSHRVTGSRTNTGNLVCCHGTAYAGAVDDYSEVRRAICNGTSHSMSKVWIINSVF